MKIVQISDTHFSPSKPHFNGNWEPIRRWIEEVKPDLVVHTGDLTIDGADQEDDIVFSMALLGELDVPVLVVPGNHDVGHMPGSQQPIDDARLERWRRLAGPDRFAKGIGGWRLIGLNGLLIGSGHAEEQAQFDWLVETLEGREGRRLAIFAHKPLFVDDPAEGDTGYVYRGKLEYEVITTDMGNLPEIPVKIMMNVGNPELAFEFAQIPNGGVGLARLEFVINNMIGIHPKAILDLGQVPANLRDEINRRSRGYATPKQFFIEKLVEGVATIAAAFYPKPVIVRLSDFKSNEYRKLLGGEIYEPEEENPMLGFRGASRYISHSFRDCFELECAAMKKVRNELGLTNVQVMVPFVRNLEEAKGVVALLAEHGLKQGENELKLIMMCEIPSNALLADQFLEYFDGFSIGSNDLTQLTLGLDRDSGLVAHAFDERDPAVKQLLSMAIKSANKLGKYVGICGQGPSDHSDFAEWLMDEGIQTISLNPDTVIDTWLKLAAHGKQ